MKSFIKTPARFMSVVIITGTMILMSCSDSICPTYIDAITRNKSLEDKDKTTRLEKGSIFSTRYQEEEKFANTGNITSENNSNKLSKGKDSTTI